MKIHHSSVVQIVSNLSILKQRQIMTQQWTMYKNIVQLFATGVF